VKPRYLEVDSTEAIFKDVLSYIEPKVAAGKLEISFKEEGDNQLVIDPHLVKQALTNVVMNAVEAMTDHASEEGGVEIRSDRRDPAVWKVHVSDDGPGISEEQIETIFEPFVTTKEGGTGLGLAIVHSVVAAHGGKVSIGSKPPHGTSVSLEFPNFQR
jgi:signal transduction histidine kinase